MVIHLPVEEVPVAFMADSDAVGSLARPRVELGLSSRSASSEVLDIVCAVNYIYILANF